MNVHRTDTALHHLDAIYRYIYYIKPDQIDVLAVVPGVRNLPK